MNRENIAIDDNVLNTLNKLSENINSLYGYVDIEGDNYGEPAINSGPCGPFANQFYSQWNNVFRNEVKIGFIMDLTKDECHHVLVILPNNLLYDGGIGVHYIDKYPSNQFELIVMKKYDHDLLDKHSFGLDRAYPRYCPNHDLTELKNLINNTISSLRK